MNNILLGLFFLILGLLLANMLTNVCGCKVVEGQCVQTDDGCAWASGIYHGASSAQSDTSSNLLDKGGCAPLYQFADPCGLDRDNDGSRTHLQFLRPDSIGTGQPTSTSTLSLPATQGTQYKNLLGVNIDSSVDQVWQNTNCCKPTRWFGEVDRNCGGWVYAGGTCPSGQTANTDLSCTESGDGGCTAAYCCAAPDPAASESTSEPAPPTEPAPANEGPPTVPPTASELATQSEQCIFSPGKRYSLSAEGDNIIAQILD